MAPKKGIFFDNPPSASSTSVEEDDDSSSENVQHSQIPLPSTPISNSKSGSTPRSGTKRSLHNNTDGSDAKLSKKKKTVTASGGSDENDVSRKSGKKDATTVNDIGSSSKKVKSLVHNTMILNEILRFRDATGFCGLDKDIVKRGLESTGEPKKAEMQDKWKQLYIAELELFVNRACLIKDQANSAVQTLEKSTN